MIVSTIQQVRKVLPSYNLKSTTSLESRLSDFLVRAQEWTVERILGSDIETLLEATVESTDVHGKLRVLTQRVICERAYILAAPEMDLQLSEAGFVVQNNEQMSPASQQRVDRLMQSLSGRLIEDCDHLVAFLVGNSVGESQYVDWRGTEQFGYLTQCFMPTFRAASQAFPGYQVSGWGEFYDTLPRMADSLHTTVANYVSDDEVETLLEMYRDNECTSVHRKAIWWMCRAVIADILEKNAEAASFSTSARGLMLLHESSFPEFVNSDRYELPSAFDLGDGTVANLL